MTGERQLIKKIKDWTGSAKIGDDCAVLPACAAATVVSSDMLVEGRHFSLAYRDFESLGWKSCAVNLSDIAAMAGRPRHLTISLALPAYVAEADLQSFYQGFSRCARTYGAEIVGGDLTGGDSLVISITVIGEAPASGALLRSGARPGDSVIVSGTFGASALGLKILQALGDQGRRPAFSPARKALVQAHLRPQPRFAEAFALVEICGNRAALMDASDGLADALYQICEASHVSMQINQDLIPIAAAVRSEAAAFACDPLQLALYGGEDYELVACLGTSADETDNGAGNGPEPSIDFLEGGLPFITIGRVVSQNEPGKPKVELLSGRGAAEKTVACVDLSNCYQHFC
ncbi:MAG: thiamine-phosphate kinase [Cyanobacteria bacterium REEB67]|nr:thiamine-phosphate kinase [Cyanobacteria bacterium REEB67]